MKRDRAAIVVHKDSTILMIHRFKSGAEYYVLPGGTVEEGESEDVAAARELYEETSIEVDLIKKLDSFVDEDGKKHYVYVSNYVSGVPKLALGSPEVAKSSKDNIYIPTWVDVTEIADITIWPKRQKPFLLNYLNNKF